MTKHTMQMDFVEALNARGETLVKALTARIVYTRKEGGYYYIGRRGSLRFGNTIALSIPCSDVFKAALVAFNNA